jgi:TonB family protein
MSRVYKKQPLWTAALVLIVLTAACASNVTVPPPAPNSASTPSDTDIASGAQPYINSWYTELRKKMIYPPLERAIKREGVVRLQVLISRSGEVIGTRMLKSSGNPDFDAEAQKVWTRITQDGVRLPVHNSREPLVQVFSMPFEVVFCLAADCAAATQARADGKSVAAMLQKSDSEALRGLYQEAIADATAAQNVFPTAQGYFYRGQEYNSVGAYDLAIADFTEMINLIPSAWTAYRSRGYAYLSKQQYAAALADFNQAIALSSDCVVCYQGRARIYAAQKQWNESIADYNRLIELEPNAVIYNGRAWTYHLMGRAADGLPDADKAIRLNPRLASLYDTRAHLYEDLGNPELAVADYRQALALNPDLTASKDGLKRLTVLERE